MSLNNNNFNQLYSNNASYISKYNSIPSSGYKGKLENKPYNSTENIQSLNAQVGKQDSVLNQASSPKNVFKKSAAQQYLKQKRPAKYQVSSDSDEDELEGQQLDENLHNHYSQNALNKQKSPPKIYLNRNQQIYQLNIKIFALQNQKNELLIQKQKTKDKYEKQIFDLNKQKSLSQQQKNKYLQQIDILQNTNKNHIEQIQQLREQLHIFIGENRKTPNFNSMTKDMGQLDLINMMMGKDQTIKQLKIQIQTIKKQKQQGKNENKPDRNSGQSFGQRNSILISFGQIQQNLKKTQNSLKQSNQIKQSLGKQIQYIRKQLTLQKQAAGKLTAQSIKVQAQKQQKIKQIQNLNQKLFQNDNRILILQKQMENLSRKNKLNEELLDKKQQQIKKLNQNLNNQEQRIKKLRKQLDKSQKEWIAKVSTLQAQLSQARQERNNITNDKTDDLRTQVNQLNTKIQLLISQNKKLQQGIQDAKIKQQKLKTQLGQKQRQKNTILSKYEEDMKKYAKYKNTCDVQLQRLVEMEKQCNEAKAQRKILKQQAEKIMRKQKNQIHTLKESMELVLQKSKRIQQLKNKQQQQFNKVSQSQIPNLNIKIQQLLSQNKHLVENNQTLHKHINESQQSVISLKKQNYQFQKEIDRVMKILHTQSGEKVSKQALLQSQNKLKLLQSQYKLLQHKFDQQSIQKDEMVRALNQKINYFQQKIRLDADNYQSINNQKTYNLQQIQNLTYKCQQMFEYIQKMNVQTQGKHKDVNINSQQIQQVRRQNQLLRKQLFKLSTEMQKLSMNYNSTVRQRSNQSPIKSIQKMRERGSSHKSAKSSSLDSSNRQHNPLESALQIMKIEKHQMVQTIEYQNQVIQALRTQLNSTLQRVKQDHQNRPSPDGIIGNHTHQTSAQILQQKLQQLKQLILQKQDTIQEMSYKNKLIQHEFRSFKQQDNQQLNRLRFQLNLSKQQKKQLHQEMDEVNSQLIRLEREKGRDRKELYNQVKDQLERKVLFIGDDVQKLKEQRKRLRKQKIQSQNHLKLQIQERQKLYTQQRSKLVSQIEQLSTQLNVSRQKLKKANYLIADERVTQSQLSNRNSKIQMEYFVVRNSNDQLVQQVQSMNQVNCRLRQYCEQMQGRNQQVIGQMQRQIQTLIGENQRLLLLADINKRKVEALQDQKIDLEIQGKKIALNRLYPREGQVFLPGEEGQLFKHHFDQKHQHEVNNELVLDGDQLFIMLENRKTMQNARPEIKQASRRPLDLYGNDQKSPGNFQNAKNNFYIDFGPNTNTNTERINIFDLPIQKDAVFSSKYYDNHKITFKPQFIGSYRI